MEYYDKKGKLAGATANEVVKIAENGSRTEITIHVNHSDKKGEEVFDGNYTMICEGGIMKMDFRQMMPANMPEMENARIEFSGDNMTIPTSLSVGQQLPDATYTMKIIMDGVPANMSNVSEIKVQDRKVEKKESVSVPAGNYDAYKLSQQSLTTMKIMGMNRQSTSSSITWISPGVGMVKSESYDQKGKLQGYTVLSSFSR